jgi:DNA-binding CsgD family transcriptional regulator/cbb3-type cytochrome oxidase subunit 3
MKVYSILFFSLFSLLLPLLSTAQTDGKINKDSFMLKANRINHYYHNHLDSAELLARELVALSESSKDTTALINAYSLIAGAFFYAQKTDSIKIWLQKSIALAEEIGKFSTSVALLNNLSLLEAKQGLYNQAIEANTRALELATQVGDSTLMVSSLTSMASHHISASSHYALAYEIYRKAERYLPGVLQPSPHNTVYSGIAGCAMYLKAFDMALEYYEKAIDWCKKHNLKLLEIQNQLSLLLLELEHLNIEAEKKHEQSLKTLGEEIEQNPNETNTLFYQRIALYFADRYGYQNWENRAFAPYVAPDFDLFLQGFPPHASTYGVEIYSNVLKVIARLKTKRGQYRSALEDYEALLVLKDSLYTKETKEALFESKSRYELLESQYQLSQLSLEVAQLELDRKKRSTTIAWLITLLGLSVLGIIFLYFRNQAKEKLAKKQRALDLAEQKQKELTLQNTQLTLDQKNQEIAYMALHLKRKSEILDQIEEKFESTQDLSKVKHKLKLSVHNAQELDVFFQSFQALERRLVEKLKQNHPNLTPRDLYLIALIKSHLSNKEIANIMNIEERSVVQNKYRLKKKLGMDPEQNWEDFFAALS